MKLVLRVSSTDGRRNVAFRPGQVVQIGRTQWANLCLPADQDLADIHCEIAVGQDQCLARNLAEDKQTLLNGEPIEEATLQHGDVILLGGSRIDVVLEGVMGPVAGSTDDGSAENHAAPPPPETVGDLPIESLCREAEVDPAELELEPTATLAEFVDAALDGQHFAPPIQLITVALPIQEAVEWGLRCVQQTSAGEPDPSDLTAVAAIQQWLAEPSEPNRRAAQAAAGPGTSATELVAASIFFSGGNIGAPEGPDIPSSPVTFQRMLAAAVLSAALENESKPAPEWYRAFCDDALALPAPAAAEA